MICIANAMKSMITFMYRVMTGELPNGRTMNTVPERPNSTAGNERDQRDLAT